MEAQFKPGELYAEDPLRAKKGDIGFDLEFYRASNAALVKMLDVVLRNAEVQAEGELCEIGELKLRLQEFKS